MLRPLAILLVVFPLGCGRERTAPPAGPSSAWNAPGAGVPVLGIGGGEADPHTHVSFATPKNLIRASVHVVVDANAATGLNFFALQVNFKNGTWAHGGVQDVAGPHGERVRQINWGGLVDRGGGSGDYKNEDPRVDLDKIQNPPSGQHLGPYAWKNGVVYEYVVERGALVTLPPGDYRLFPDAKTTPVGIDHPRSMWEWRFTVHPISVPGPDFTALLYDSADEFTSAYVWNESGGGGATRDQQHTSWSLLQFRALGGPAVDQAPASWKRFLSPFAG